MKDWGIQITYDPDELEAKILKRPSIQNENGPPKLLDDTSVLSKIVHQPMELTQWAIFCVRRDVENAKYIQDKFYDISQQQKLGVYVDYGRIISLDDRATVNSFKEAIEKFYCDEIAPQNQGKKQYGAKKQVNKEYKDLSKGYVFLVIMPDSIR